MSVCVFLCIDLSLAIKIKTFAYKNEAAFLFTATVQIVSLFCRLLLRCNLRIFFTIFPLRRILLRLHYTKTYTLSPLLLFSVAAAGAAEQQSAQISPPSFVV